MQAQTNFESYTATTKWDQLWKALENPAFRREYSDDVGTGLAFQIKALREHRGWTQQNLAQVTGKQQETISQLENPDYGSYTLRTLNRLSAAFDVGLVVRFAPFSELVDWAVRLSPDRIAPPSFTQEHQAPQAAITLPSLTAAAVGVVAAGVAPTNLPLESVDWGGQLPLLPGKYEQAAVHEENQYALAA